jgi:hypothetical protein
MFVGKQRVSGKPCLASDDDSLSSRVNICCTSRGRGVGTGKSGSGTRDGKRGVRADVPGESLTCSCDSASAPH